MTMWLGVLLAGMALAQQPADQPELMPLLPGEQRPAQTETTQTTVSQSYPAGATVFVNATSLALRASPSVDGLLIHYMPNNTRLVVLDRNEPPVRETIGGKDGEWIPVRHGSHRGYVFDAYVSAAPPTLDERIDWLIVPGERVGPINKNTSYEELVEFFGMVNVGEAKIPIGEGETEPGTAIFPDQPDKTLFIQWEEFHETPKAVIVAGKRWKTTRGITLGTRLSTLRDLNGGPISFAGFDWEYAGYITSWRGGTLERDHRLQEQIRLHLVPREPYLPADYEALVGDREFDSENVAAGKINLEIGNMTVLIN